MRALSIRRLQYGGRRINPHPAGVIGFGVIMVVLVAGCSAPASETGQPAPASSSAPAATPNVNGGEWAESVCGAADEVRTTLDAIGSGITFSPAAEESAREQVKTTLNAQVTAVSTAITALGSAVQAIPVDADGADELKSSLTTSRQALDEAVQAVSAGAADVSAATTAKDFVTAGAQTVQAAKTAKGSATTLLTTAHETATTAGGDLKAAFDSAPSCAQPTESPT
jgi:hypothetical protein